MASHDLDTVLGWRGSTVIDRDGEKIGTLKELYLDQDDRPAWAAVETGLFGLRQSFVPLEGASALDDQVRVPFAKDHVKDAPNVDPDAQLTEDEEARLHDHYHLDRDDAAPDDEVRSEDDAMTRSEEELVVGTRRKVRGKARLKKYVVTEHVQRTIPVQREEVRVEYEPAEGTAAPEGDPPADR
jgi:sporulation protein YlmC with PRC-barrel domain